MGLLVDYLTRRSAARLLQLTNSDNPGGIRSNALAGTVAVTTGSAAVVGTGTAFLSYSVDQVIQFDSQPGVNYVIQTIASDTSLTLYQNYVGPTNAAANASMPAVNYVTLQDAVWDAQAHFQTETDFVYDDVTQNANNAGANPTLNKCLWAGVALVDAYLYEYRGQPWPEAEVQAAWATANRRLKAVLNTYGDGAFSPPVTDSVFQPSTGPVRLPEFDNERWGDISPLPPGPAFPNGGSYGGGDWGW